MSASRISSMVSSPLPVFVGGTHTHTRDANLMHTVSMTVNGMREGIAERCGRMTAVTVLVRLVEDRLRILPLQAAFPHVELEQWSQSLQAAAHGGHMVRLSRF